MPANPEMEAALENIKQIDAVEKFGATEFRFRFRHHPTQADLAHMTEPGHPLYETLIAKKISPDDITLYLDNMKFWENRDGTFGASILYEPSEPEPEPN